MAHANLYTKLSRETGLALDYETYSADDTRLKDLKSWFRRPAHKKTGVADVRA